MTDLTSLIAAYLDGPRLLRAAVAGMSAEQLQARPVPGRWSTLEVIAHLVDFDPIQADRMKRIIAEDHPTLIGASEERFAAALAYSARQAEDELTLLELTRRQMGTILRTLPPEAFARVGNHTERGPIRLDQLVASTTHHIVHHVRFIEEKRRALGLPASTGPGPNG